MFRHLKASSFSVIPKSRVYIRSTRAKTHSTHSFETAFSRLYEYLPITGLLQDCYRIVTGLLQDCYTVTMSNVQPTVHIT